MIVYVKERYNHIYMICMSIFFIYMCFSTCSFKPEPSKKKTNASKSQAFGHDLHTKLMRCIAVRRLGSRLRRLRLGWRMRLFWRRNRWKSGKRVEAPGNPWWFEWLKVNWWLHLMVKYLMVSYIWWLSTWWLLHECFDVESNGYFMLSLGVFLMFFFDFQVANVFLVVWKSTQQLHQLFDQLRRTWFRLKPHWDTYRTPFLLNVENREGIIV